MPVFTCNSQTCGWGRGRTLYADVLRGACLTPTNLCGVSAVVSPYLLLPLVSRLVNPKDSRMKHGSVVRRWRTDESFHSVGGIRKAEFHENPKFASKPDSILLSVCRPWLLNLHILPVYPFLSSPLCSISVIAPSVVKPSEIVAGEVRLPSTRVTIIFSSVCIWQCIRARLHLTYYTALQPQSCLHGPIITPSDTRSRASTDKVWKYVEEWRGTGDIGQVYVWSLCFIY